MAGSPKTKGRMINKDISDSKGFALLSPQAAVLFCMMIPHYSAHGKMNGSPEYLRGEVCPRIPYLTVESIPQYLKEISDKTSVKWFEHDGRWWIHSIHFLSEHQTLKPEKMGADQLPNYSGVTPELLPPEVEVEVEVEVEGEGEESLFPVRSGEEPPAEPAPDAIIWPEELSEVPEKLKALDLAGTDLMDPPYWKRLVAWSDSRAKPITLFKELDAWAAWFSGLTKAEKPKLLKKSFRNWCAKRERWDINGAQRDAIRATQYGGRR